MPTTLAQDFAALGLTGHTGPTGPSGPRFQLGDQVKISPPLPRCQYMTGTYVKYVPKDFYTYFSDFQTTMKVEVTQKERHIIRLESGLEIAVSMDRLKELHPLEQLARVV